jgi:hypothetical protein
MIRALGLVWVLLLSLGCKANLVVTRVQLNSWDSDGKSVTATVRNKCTFGLSLFCKPAGTFLVYFDGKELPPSVNYLPQVTTSVAGLGRGESIDLAADFMPLARIENNYLWNVTHIRVTADPKHQVPESSEADNVRRASVPFSSELPIVIIETLGGTIVDEPKIPASMKVIYDPAGGRNFINAPANDYDGRIGIELRGELTLMFCKKQYGVETWDQGNNDLQASLLQLPAEEDWILYGPYSDKSLFRNVFAYGLSSLMGRYAPRTKFVELFVTDPGLPGTSCPAVAPDNYLGVYVLMEKIKRDANRVNVAKLGATDNTEPAVTGGYLLKKDWLDPGDATFTTSGASGYGTTLTYVYPKCKSPAPCDATAQQKTWIENYVNDFEAALKGPGFNDPINGYARYIDVSSFVDYYLLEELLKNSDGFRASTYMYKNRNAKLKMGPIWDMNFTMGNVGFAAARPPQGWLIGAVGGQMAWWSRLLQDEAFAQVVIDRWQTLRQGQFKTSNLHLTMDNRARFLRYAQERNFNRWPILGTWVVGNPTPVDPDETYGDGVEQAKTWIEARANWIDSNIAAILPP